jgi:hypothetical protein
LSLIRRNPASVGPVVRHLATWGEVSVTELRRMKDGQECMPPLIETGLVEEIRENGSPVCWALTPKGEYLLALDSTTAMKVALFQVPSYRKYLVGILAEGLVTAAKAGMHDRVEKWTGAELAPWLGQINAILDSIEEPGGRLVDATSMQIASKFSGLPIRRKSYWPWDQLLLSRTARPSNLFDSVLRKFVPIGVIPSPPPTALPAAVLRSLPLNSDDGFTWSKELQEAPWNVRRRRIRSSVPLFDEQGQSLFASTTGSGQRCLPSIQDALMAHPFYSAVVQLAIAAWRSPASSTPAVELQIPPGGEAYDTRIVLGGKDAARLRDVLPRLVEAQDIRPHGLTNGMVLFTLMANVIRNLTALQVLVQNSDQLELHPEFRATLMASRLRTVFRPGKSLQQRILEVLLEIQGDGGRAAEVDA